MPTSYDYTLLGNHSENTTVSWDMDTDKVGEIYEQLVCRANDYNGGASNSTSYNKNVSFKIKSGAGNISSQNITSIDTFNLTTSTLNCSATITDEEGDNINATVYWYENETLKLEVDYNNSYANGTIFEANLTSGNTTEGDNWSCGLE